MAETLRSTVGLAADVPRKVTESMRANIRQRERAAGLPKRLRIFVAEGDPLPAPSAPQHPSFRMRSFLRSRYFEETQMSCRHRLLALVILGFASPLAAQDHHGLDPSNLDTTCAPCQDFYRFANGGWLTRTALPPEYPSYGSFTELVERNNATLRRIVERLAPRAPRAPKTAEQKLGAFYASCMDSSAIEQAGVGPLKNELARLDAIASRDDVARALARGHHHGWDPVFNFGGTADYKHSTMVIAAATQGGLGLPDRDYYVRDDSTARTLRTAYLEYVSRTLGTAVPVADWRAYLRWHFTRHLAPWLSSPFVDASFRYQRALTGVKEQQPRWKRCVQAANAMLGDALGQTYVRETFTPDARRRALDMVDHLIAALDDRLHTLEWMGDSTRAQAVAKLRAFGKKIGYPDKWRDYSKLAVDRQDFAGNVVRAQTYLAAWDFARIGKPVDKAEWRMTAPTVNASYSPTFNDITFPAGILQAPFFDPAADDAVNYGGMGAVIGHEMTHGFRDQGRQIDAAGNLRDWWTADDAQRFKDRAGRVAAQFDAYTVVDSSTHVNGRLTLGEDIADLGGLKVAYAAFQRALAGKPRPPAIDGFSAEQRFFLAWAQIWRAKATDQYLRNQVVVDPHAPARWRGMGPLSNLKEFADAWGCKTGDPMVRPDSLRATIW